MNYSYLEFLQESKHSSRNLRHLFVLVTVKVSVYLGYIYSSSDISPVSSSPPWKDVSFLFFRTGPGWLCEKKASVSSEYVEYSFKVSVLVFSLEHCTIKQNDSMKELR